MFYLLFMVNCLLIIMLDEGYEGFNGSFDNFYCGNNICVGISV